MANVTFTDHSDEVLRALAERIEAALEAVGVQAVSHATQTITAAGRIASGAMRSSISHKVAMGESAVYIGTNIEYAQYHEFGTGIYIPGGRQTPWAYQDAKGEWHKTRGVKPIHFLKDAAANHTSEYKGIIQMILQGK